MTNTTARRKGKRDTWRGALKC